MMAPRAAFAVFVALGIVLPRPPSFDYVEAAGCGDLFLMAWTSDSSEVLSITLRGFPTGSREETFDLMNSAERIQVRVDAFDGPEAFRRCGDLGRALTDMQDPTSGWLAVAGRLKLSVDRRRSIASVVVDDLVVQSIKKDRVRATRAIRFHAALHGTAA